MYQDAQDELRGGDRTSQIVTIVGNETAGEWCAFMASDGLIVRAGYSVRNEACDGPNCVSNRFQKGHEIPEHEVGRRVVNEVPPTGRRYQQRLRRKAAKHCGIVGREHPSDR